MGNRPADLCRHPNELRSDVLWDMVYDLDVNPAVRSQLCEIARHVDGEHLRLHLIVIE